MKRASSLILWFSTMTWSLANASTVTIDMEGIAPEGGIVAHTDTISSFNGFELLVESGVFIDAAWPEAGSTRAGNGTDYLGVDNLGLVTVFRPGNEPFSILSFDATDVFTDASFIPGLEFEVNGTLMNGTLLSQTFVSDSSHAFETFFFDPEWTNLEYVTFLGNEHAAFDNIAVSTLITIPVPAALLLFASGLLGFAGLAGRRNERS